MFNPLTRIWEISNRLDHTTDTKGCADQISQEKLVERCSPRYHQGIIDLCCGARHVCDTKICRHLQQQERQERGGGGTKVSLTKIVAQFVG